MLNTGDLHNFGQRVVPVERASGSFFQKPRSLYWEHLLFGRESRLRPCLASASRLWEGRLGIANGSMADALFGLELEMDSRTWGFSRRVDPLPSSQLVTNQELERFGMLLGYAYCLGIRDLHRGNLLRTARGPQVVDAEVVFADLILPSETLLLPYKGTPFDRSGIGALAEARARLELNGAESVLKGFLCAMMTFVESTATISSLLSEELACYKQIPIRHIVRDTATYRRWKESGLDFFPAELDQLKRGDVPYFFKYIDQPELYYYVSEVGDRRVAEVPIHLLPAVQREAVHPKHLLDPARIAGKLTPAGMLYVARSLFPAEYLGVTFLGYGTELVFTEQLITCTGSFGTFSAARKRIAAQV